MAAGDTFKTISSKIGEGYYTDRRSKFLAFAYPVTTEEEALARVAELRAKYYDARHVCWAYRLGPTELHSCRATTASRAERQASLFWGE